VRCGVRPKGDLLALRPRLVFDKMAAWFVTLYLPMMPGMQEAVERFLQTNQPACYLKCERELRSMAHLHSLRH